MEKTQDFLDLLINAIAERVKVSLKSDIEQIIADHMPKIEADSIANLEDFINEHVSIEADDVKGLERFIDNHDFNLNPDDITGLDRAIGEGIDEAIDHDEIARNVCVEIAKRLTA